MTRKAGISAFILLMIGNPCESEESIDETIKLLYIIKPDKIRTTLTKIYPATDLYRICKERELIDDDYWLTEKAAPIYTGENSLKKLKKWERRINFSYFLQRGEVFRIFEMILYRAVFGNFREMMRRLGPRIDKRMERIDHLLHSK
jgi:hypothetical protein